MKIRALIFDLDDTLYDQIQPFRRAILKHLQVPADQLEPLYLAFRHYADEIFEAAATGKVSLYDSHVYRMKAALADFGYAVTEVESIAIQLDYELYQGQLELDPMFEELFAYCQRKGIELGVITNGPHRHQLRKIRSLGLEKWIAEDRLIISGQVGVAKPAVDIFKLLESRLGVEAESICYLGDSFENDVVGSKQAGWQSIWFNHRKRTVSVTSYQADKVITEWNNLVEVIQSLE
ncbi:TPA: HAD family hydrolase [Streptococcus suis]